MRIFAITHIAIFDKTTVIRSLDWAWSLSRDSEGKLWVASEGDLNCSDKQFEMNIHHEHHKSSPLLHCYKRRGVDHVIT